MSAAESSSARKQVYFNKLVKLLEEYPKIVICGADNVGSNQMQLIRKALRGQGVLLMGKNTMIRKAVRGQVQNNAALEALLPLIKGNVGFVFTKADLSAIKKTLTAQKVAAPAKVGAIAPVEVIVKAGPTGLEPTQTSFLQALNIPSKINKGQVEIVNDVKILDKGQRVGASEANLLAKLNVKPFQYGLIIKTVYDNGSIYDAKVLDITDEDIVAKFQRGVKNIACVSLAAGVPTLASLPHSLARGFKNILSVALITDVTFKQAEAFKNALANPQAAAPAAASAPAKEEKKEAPKKEEKKEEEDEDMGLGLFD
jgi:large subunit ribosomal protein LP0